MEYSIGVISFAIVTVLISILIFKRRRQTKQEAADRRVAGLAADLQAGGAGRAGGGGRVEGEVAVYVLASESGVCAGVCVCPVLQVIYWWRLSLSNGQVLSVPGEAVAGERVTQARAGAAAIRLWGEMWAGADRVTIHLQHISDSTARMRLEEQAEDCQNKFGVRVSVECDQERGTGRTDGGRALCDQLVAGGGVGQAEEGWHNTNLRMVNDTVHQLVDHTTRLQSHFFEI